MDYKNIVIRKAERQDVPLLLEFIRGIARYEKMENEVIASADVLERELFDEHRAEAVFALVDGREVGFALYIIDEMRKLLLFFLLIILCQFDAQAENGHRKEKPKSHLEYEGNYVVLDWPRTSKFGWAHKHKDGEVYVYVRNGNCYKPFSHDCGHYDILVISVNGKIVQVHKIAMGEKLNKAAKEYLSGTDKHSSY
jgi:hypothetical protein